MEVWILEELNQCGKIYYGTPNYGKQLGTIPQIILSLDTKQKIYFMVALKVSETYSTCFQIF